MAKKKKTDFDVESILQDFADLPDPRSHINQRHLLGDVIVISIMAVIAGAEGPKAIGVWAKSNEDWLADRLQHPNGIPSHDTIGRVLKTIKPSAFQVCFERWIKHLSGNRDKGKLDVIAIDGKPLRRSHDKAADLGP
ncbi:ISAs1 family transposase, partial [Rhodopirellula sallentina]